MCLRKVPAERPSAKELLKHRFIRSARKSPRLLERIRERPKYQLKEETDIVRNGLRGHGEGSGTVRATREPRVDETVRASNQGNTFRNAGWDFSIGGSQSTGTVRSVVRPPPVRARGEENSNEGTATPKRTSEGDNQWLSASGNGLYESSEVSLGRYSRDEEKQNNLRDYEEGSGSGSGTVVVRSSAGRQVSHSDQSSQSSSAYASLDDASTSGTMVVRGKRDDPESPRTPKSRLGDQERTSGSSSLEDSATNLAEARAAMQKGLRKGISGRGRTPVSKVNKDLQENKTADPMSPRRSGEHFDVQRAFSRSQPASDDEDIARTSVVSSSAALSALLVPSVKEVLADASEGSGRALSNALIDMERMKPGSSELLISRLLHRLGSSRDPSLKDLQELAAHIFSRSTKALEQSQSPASDADSKKKQQTKDFLSNPNISPLAKFLVSRWHGQASRDLNPT